MYLQREEKGRICSAVKPETLKQVFSPTTSTVLHTQIFVVFPQAAMVITTVNVAMFTA
jgi:hypothetical protein